MTTKKAKKSETSSPAKLPRDRAAVITVLKPKWTRRKGSLRAKRFAMLKTGMTVGEFRKKGGTRGFLRFAVRNGLISIQPPKAKKAKAVKPATPTLREKFTGSQKPAKTARAA